MGKRSETFFTDDEKLAIESVIKEVETRTSGEIVAVVVDKSDDYKDIDVLGSMIISACLSVYPAELFYANADFLIRKILPAYSWFSQIPDSIRFILGLGVFLTLSVIFYAPIKMIFVRVPFLKRFFLPDKRKEIEIRQRAINAFFEHGLGNTRDATGVLFLISIFEKKVYVLADHGIYKKISSASFDGYAATVGSGIAQNRAASTLCEAIRAIGADLTQHFPVKSDDINELTNKVIIE